MKRSLLIIYLCCCWLAIGYSTPTSAYEFISLGHLPPEEGVIENASSTALGMSADGSVIYGVSFTRSISTEPYVEFERTEGYRWTRKDGMVGLGTLPNYQCIPSGQASADGTAVAGYCEYTGEDNNTYSLMARWDTTEGWRVFGSLIPDSPNDRALAVSGDGSIVVGTGESLLSDGTRISTALYWSEETGVKKLCEPTNDEYHCESATNITADASVIIGLGVNHLELNTTEAYRLTISGGIEWYGALPDGLAYTSVADVSADGTVIVGSGVNIANADGFWRSPSGAYEVLFFYDTAYAASLDGSIVVGKGCGQALVCGEALVWDPVNYRRSIKTILVKHGGLNLSLSGWSLEAASNISDDGRIASGWGTNPDGFREAWVAEIAPSANPPAFQPLGIEYRGYSSWWWERIDVSADGNVVAGSGKRPDVPLDNTSGYAFRWNPDHGVEWLGCSDPGYTLEKYCGDYQHFYGSAISANGSRVVGYREFDAEPGLFYWPVLGNLSLNNCDYVYLHGWPLDLSADGSVVVHYMWALSETVYLTVIFDGNTGERFCLPTAEIDGRAISADGTKVAGTGRKILDRTTGLISPGGVDVPTRITSDATVIVGKCLYPDRDEGCTWDSVNGVVGLGDLPGGQFSSNALDVSGDGSVIVGSGTSAVGEEAVVWFRSTGLHNVSELLEERGIDMTGWQLIQASGVSADGRTIVGWGYNPRGSKDVWRAKINPPSLSDAFLPLGIRYGGSTWVGDGVHVSADGSVVAGSGIRPYIPSPGYTDHYAFRWEFGTGVKWLGCPAPDVTGYCPDSRSYFGGAISGDGTTVVGSVRSSLDPNFAYKWDTVNGAEYNISECGVNPNEVNYSAQDTSIDGSVTLGLSLEPHMTVIWDETNNITCLSSNEGYPTNYGYAISGDGTKVVGSATGIGAFVWDNTNGMVGLGMSPDGLSADVGLGISTDGSVIVGRGSSPEGIEAFIWSNTSGVSGLGDLPGGDVRSEALDVSDDGSVVVGFGTSAAGEEAVVWYRSTGIHTVSDLLEEHGVDTTGWQFRRASGVSADGKFIVGWGINPEGIEEVWRANITLPFPSRFLQVTGIAQGGTIFFTVAGVDLLVTTTAGIGPEQVIQAMVNAINSNSTLSGMGITALAVGDTMYVSGELTNVTLTDPGLVLTYGFGDPPPADGDINLDGEVNVADLLLGRQVLNDSVTLTPEQFIHGDVAPLSYGMPEPDGLFTLGDLLTIERKTLGLIDF